jgi:hypothetical protein
MPRFEGITNVLTIFIHLFINIKIKINIEQYFILVYR